MKANKNIWIFNHYAITPNLPGWTRHFDFGRKTTKIEEVHYTDFTWCSREGTFRRCSNG